jgi:hypothetical protein
VVCPASAAGAQFTISVRLAVDEDLQGRGDFMYLLAGDVPN